MQRPYAAVALSYQSNTHDQITNTKTSNTKRRPQGRRAWPEEISAICPVKIPAPNAARRYAAPDWTENGPRRISYLWHCQACDYKFEAVAFYDASHSDQQALAA